MAVISGITSVVSNQKNVSGWSIVTSNKPAEYVASGMGAGQASESGNFDWTGRFAFYGVAPDIFPGDSFSFVGFTGTDRWSGTAMVESLTMRGDIEGGGIVSGEVTFGGDGALSSGAGTNTDANVPNAQSLVGLGIDWAGSALTDVRTWDFTITRKLLPYVSSTTAGITKRKAGVTSASGTFSVYQDAAASILVPGATEIAKFYVTSGTFWQFSYAKIASANPNYDPETGALNGVSYPWSWTSHKRITGTMTRGTIIRPSTTAQWS